MSRYQGEVCRDCGGYSARDIGVHTRDCPVLMLRTNMSNMAVSTLRRLRAEGVPVGPIFVRDRDSWLWYGPLGFEALEKASGLAFLPAKALMPESYITAATTAFAPGNEDMAEALSFCAASAEKLPPLSVSEVTNIWLDRVSRLVRQFENGAKVEHYLRTTRDWVRATYGREHDQAQHYGD